MVASHFRYAMSAALKTPLCHGSDLYVSKIVCCLMHNKYGMFSLDETSASRRVLTKNMDSDNVNVIEKPDFC